MGPDQELVGNVYRLVKPAVEEWLRRSLASGETERAIVCVHFAYSPTWGEGYKIGDLPESEWPHPFDDFAKEKAQMALKYQRDVAKVISESPHLIQRRDIKWRGGIYFDGIGIGVSGVQSWYDEMIARWFSAAIRAYAGVRVQTQIEDEEEEDYFR